ncbi:PREDICTED: LRR receptor [Prunus dulcis]|uniref:PREDICTED: LRR receptor n=1 Tax=Prunus dulcis TaxID=3755 RepID=A0A5E4EAR0_PRUDU|nr:hypothetical protein L3X38_014652 [Prunus dulcis]VVA10848.1 PREDICTED: LRR receptor [Prunus dulcis]
MVGLLAPRARLSNVASEANTIGGSKSTKYGNFRYHPDLVFEHVFPVVVSKSVSQPTVWGDSKHSWQASSSIDLSSNQFTGNNLTGSVPTSIGFLHKLTSLQLHNNHLSGEFPLSMQNCTSLLVVDLGKNKLVGSLPIWMGKSLSNLEVLNNRSNELQGDIPYELCYLKNPLSGAIPRCFHNFSAMAALPISDTPIAIAEYVMDNVMLVTKGREMEYYFKMLRLVISIDLSDNIISGEIPEELASLLGLRSLNLSKNLLTGSIPSKISNMKWLESIPKSTQLQSLDQSSFIGNHLCGPPLNDDCGTANRMIPPTFEQDRGYHLLEDKWFYLSLGIGFVLGVLECPRFFTGEHAMEHSSFSVP